MIRSLAPHRHGHLVLKLLQKVELEVARAHGESNRHAMTIDILPDDILLEIFAFCLHDPRTSLDSMRHMRVWQRLVHICQRWRQIIYASPRRLDLHLCCSNNTPFRTLKNLSLWRDFPLAVVFFISKGQDDLIAALEHPARVRRINILTTMYQDVFEVVEAMRVPFPALTHLELTAPEDNDYDPDVLDIPDGFLGGSAPCLRHLHLKNISFPGLPTLLLSARDLVSLQLDSVPPTYSNYGHISPEEMVSSLAVLTKLRTLSIYRYPSDQSPLPSDEQRRGPVPPMLAVLPALTRFEFGCDFGYLEDLVAQIDAPRVEDVRIDYLMDEVQTRQLSQFIDRSNLKLAQFRRAKVTIHPDSVNIELDLPQGECIHAKFFIQMILDDTPIVPPLLYVVHVLGQLVAMTSNVGHLRVSFQDPPTPSQVGQDLLESDEWLPLLRLFSAVEVLEVSGGLEGCIASAFEDATEETLLPALQLL
ncbi:hypothetical protein EDB89DRAFT_2203228 [Lactarius sanguifluus]|nr:hypothetical protein EDB89DRAFT_2203228 [Lactarius sanguifluus]